MIPKKLFFQNELVAFLSESQIEWPRSDSIYEIHKELRSELIDYIQSSIDYSILVDKNDEEAMQYHVDNVEIKFTHLINSDEWFIVDNIDKKHKILAPMFHLENIMVWMLK